MGIFSGDLFRISERIPLFPTIFKKLIYNVVSIFLIPYQVPESIRSVAS